jgi:tetratricopeptide (TPR) repeat protein
MRSRSWSGLLLSVLTVALAACGVQIEVVTPPPLTPTPRVWSFLRNDDSAYARTQATPRMVFSEDGRADVQLFMQSNQQSMYVVQFHQVWINVAYTVTWFGAAQSNARVRLTLYQRTDPEVAWQGGDSDERELRTEAAPATQQDTVGRGFYAETTGRYFIRTEVSVVAFPPGGQIVNQVSTNEFTALVLRDPGEIKTEGDALNEVKVPLGDLPIDKPLWDWRAWLGGPCALQESAANDASHENIKLACASLTNRDLLNARNALTVAAQQAQTPELTAALNAQLGLLAGYTGDFGAASRAFDAAIRAYETTADALRLSITLHNLASAYLWLGNDEAAGQVLDRLYELRSQFWDEFGTRLTDVNTSYHEKNADRLDSLRWYFSNLGLTDYYSVIELWMNQLRNPA